MRSARLLWLMLALTLAGQTVPRNVVLVTADGLRWQELFTGIDPMLMNEKSAGMQEADKLRKELWKDSPEARRSALLAFFWTKLAPLGIVAGNVRKGSSVEVTNGFRVSYPGYSEILTGRAQDATIRGNDKLQNPSMTVLEFVRKKLGLGKPQVALFGSWDVFRYIGESQPGSVSINAGWEAADGSARMMELSALQWQIPTPWPSVRHDYITFEMALDHMTREKPRLIHIALGESDDWAHDRRYDRVLLSIRYFDQALEKLWGFLQSHPDYKGNTCLVVTSDHGRGSTLETWASHGSKIEGAQQIWLAMIGPGIPARGELTDVSPVFQRDIAPTILNLMGIEWTSYTGVTGKPIAFPPATSAR